jgi:hypothetical protein
MNELHKKIGNFDYYLSERKDKKLKVFVNGKWVHFGNSNYQHFYDKSLLLDKNLNHLDQKRRNNYLKRSLNIKNKNDEYTAFDINSPNYHSRLILW